MRRLAMLAGVMVVVLSVSVCSSDKSAPKQATAGADKPWNGNTTSPGEFISLQGDWISISDRDLRLKFTSDMLVVTTGPLQLAARYRVLNATPNSVMLDLDWSGSKEKAIVLIHGESIEFKDGDRKGASTIGGEWRRLR